MFISIKYFLYEDEMKELFSIKPHLSTDDLRVGVNVVVFVEKMCD